MAEPIRLRPAAGDLGTGAMLRALLAAPAIDTTTLACLAGRWCDGEVLIGWQPRRTTDRLAELTGTDDGCRWIGSIDYRGECWFGLFDTLLRRDHTGCWWLSGAPELAEPIERFPCAGAGPVRLLDITATERDHHLAAVERAISGIRAGQLYQVNVCARLSGTILGEPVELFSRGLEQLAPDYAAFLRTPDRTVVSLSPELFLHRRGRAVRSAPIKGTRLRTGEQPDDPGATELRRSAKDRAENVMIVDLVRNDLSRVCEPGTVMVGELLGIRPAPGVWHLVSEVTGRLTGASEVPDLLAAAFPPGSVTGAPKLRACQLIDELEPAGRGLFTGTIGYSDQHNSEFSVAIRTFEITGNRFELGAGGGITAESVPMAEWQECRIKVAPLLALAGARWPGPAESVPAESGPAESGPADSEPADSELEWVDRSAGIFDTLLCRDGRLVGLADHLARLEASCLELYGCGLPADLPARLASRGQRLTGRHRIRLTVRPAAEPLIEIGPAAAAGGRLALHRADRPAGNWRHKWVDRRWLGEDGAAALFPTADGCVAETGTANLVVIPAEGLLRTPVLSADVLPGVTRRRFLDAALDHGWRVELGRVDFADLRTARLVLALSSIRELVLVDRLDGVGLDVDHRLLEIVSGWLG